MNISVNNEFEGQSVMIGNVTQELARKIVQFVGDAYFGAQPPPVWKKAPSIADLDEKAMRELGYLVKLHLQADNNKILAIKAVRFMFQGTDLKTAKEFVYWINDCSHEVGNSVTPGRISFNYDSPNLPSWISWIYRS